MNRKDEFNLGEYQSPRSPVVLSGPTAAPVVQYGYDGRASGENYDRLSSETYPNGAVLDYGYNNNSLDDAISRVDFLADASGSASGHLVDYEYEGLSTMVQQADANGVTLNTSLNQFGEVSNEDWTIGTGCSATTNDEFTYAYDRDGDVLYKDNQLSSANSELYHTNSSASGDDNSAYDPLGRLTYFQRGTLSSSGHNSGDDDTVTSPSETKSYALDAVGNQVSVTTNGGTPVTSTVDSRNELTDNGSADLTQDKNGNTTTDQNGNTYVYNAWNQIVGGTKTNSYDALGRRVTSNSNDLYYSNQGQIIQQDVTTTSGCSTTTSVADQYIYNTDYVNDLLLRDDNSTDSGNLGISGSGLGERLFTEHDANFNVTSLADTSGAVAERFVYDPYGTVTVLSPGWTSASDSYGWSTLFQGMWQDSNTGLYYTPNRDYDASLGRWMEADPAGYVDGANTYQFVDGDPTGLADPLGTAAGRPLPVPGPREAELVTNPRSPINAPFARLDMGGVNAQDEMTEGLTARNWRVDIYTWQVEGPTDGHCYLLSARVTLNQEIIINSKLILGDRILGTYGHEQLHVANGIEIAATVKQAAQLLLDGEVAMTKSEAALEAEDLKDYLETKLVGLLAKDSEHKYHDDPKAHEPYPVNGDMPKTADPDPPPFVREAAAHVRAEMTPPTTAPVQR